MDMTGEPAAESTAQPADGPVAVDDPTAAEEHMTTDMTDATAITAARRPTKFMADLSRAMQTAAESSRDETMTRFASRCEGRGRGDPHRFGRGGRRPPPPRR